MSGLWDAAAARPAVPERAGGDPCLSSKRGPQPSRFWSYASPLLALADHGGASACCCSSRWARTRCAGLQVFFWEPIKSGYALGELMVKATPLLIIALGPGGVLPLQRLEHRRRGPVRHRRHRRRRRGAAGRQEHRPLDRAGRSCWPASPGGMVVGRHHGAAARPLQRQRDPGQPDAGLRGGAAAGLPGRTAPGRTRTGYNFPQTRPSRR